jgi:hypothetical protein
MDKNHITYFFTIKKMHPMTKNGLLSNKSSNRANCISISSSSIVSDIEFEINSSSNAAKASKI